MKENMFLFVFCSLGESPSNESQSMHDKTGLFEFLFVLHCVLETSRTQHD